MSKKKVVGGTGITAGENVTFGNLSGQITIGDQFTIKSTNEALVKFIAFKDRKRQESFNEKILKSYTSVLPDYPREFVIENRSDELSKALAYLQDHRILLISGIGGVGKTTLARALVDKRPVNIPLPFWFDFSKKVDATLGDVLEKLASYMNTLDIARFKKEGKEAGQDDIDGLIGELQKREPVWLVFDNLEIILDGRYFHDQGMDSLFTSLRGSTHQAKIIVTSRTLPLLRNRESLIDAIDEENQELKGLRLKFAVDYLIKNGLDGLEYEKLEKLAIGVDGHPLALKLLIELIKKFGVSDTLNNLDMYQKHKEDTIKKARRLFDKLAGDEKELLERISVFRKSESISAIKEMFTEQTSKDAVEKLIDNSLLETDRKGKYWLHPVVREFAYDDLENKIEVHKLAWQYYHSLSLPEKRTTKEDIRILIEAHYHACMAKEYDEAARIIFDNNLDEDLDRWGDYRTLVELYVRVLPKDHFRDKPLISDIKIHSSILGKLGIAYLNLGDFKKSIEYYEKTLKMAQEIEDRQSEGIWLGNLGNAYFYLGDFKKSIENYEKALKIAQEIEDRQSEGIWLGRIGLVYNHQGEAKKAIEYCEMALKIAQKIGDRKGEGTLLGYIGIANKVLGDMRKAIEYHEKALKIAQEIKDRRNEGVNLGNAGISYLALGDVRKAIDHFEKALKIAQEIEDRRNESIWVGGLGQAYHNLGDLKKSIENYEKALKIAQEIGARRIEMLWLFNLAMNYRNPEQTERAVEFLKKAFEIKKALEIGQKIG